MGTLWYLEVFLGQYFSINKLFSSLFKSNFNEILFILINPNTADVLYYYPTSFKSEIHHFDCYPPEF